MIEEISTIDLDGEINDMVNRKFEQLLLNMEDLELEIVEMVNENFWDLI